MDYQRCFDVPLIYQQAISEAEIDFPLPVSSRQINYAAFADGQLGGRFVRFEAPVEDCLRHLETVQAWFRSSRDQEITWEREKITSPSAFKAAPRETGLGPLPWFDVHLIRNGFHLHSPLDLKMPPEMWVDLDTGVFYYW